MNGTLASFKAHRDSADSRGIPFRFTFAEWWAIWEPHWARRHLDKLCMCRNGDVGDYSVGNVHIATRSQNAQEWQANRAVARADAKLAEPLASAPEPEHAPIELPAPTTATLRSRMQRAELDEFLNAMRETGGNVSAAARRLGITFRAARYILHKHGMTKNDAIARLLT